jgi:hypothetical protein
MPTELPPRPVTIGKTGRVTSIDGRQRRFKVLDEVVVRQRVVDRGSSKLIYFQKIQFEQAKRMEYRFAYYMLGVKPGAKGRWVFGQYAPMIPATELKKLLAAARARAWDGF